MSAVAVVQAASSPAPTGAETVLFWVLAPLMVLAALGLLLARKAVHAALGMAVVMVSLGVIYLVQDADFLGVIQVFVYTGAVMMLFLFVLMLVGVDSADSLVETITGQRWAGLLLAAGVGLLVLTGVGSAVFGRPAGTSPPSPG
jgi:NADH-quinone oxidoreductase subunit J